jgi:hypothetical protein
MLEEALVNTLSIKVRSPESSSSATNGLACLGCSYSSFVPKPLDTFRQKDIIAILWTDLVVTDNITKITESGVEPHNPNPWTFNLRGHFPEPENFCIFLKTKCTLSVFLDTYIITIQSCIFPGSEKLVGILMQKFNHWSDYKYCENLTNWLTIVRKIKYNSLPGG